VDSAARRLEFRSLSPKLAGALGLLLAAAGAGAPARIDNTFELAFPDGSGQIEWVSASAFRVLRRWGPPEAVGKAVTAKPIAVWAGVSGAAYSFKSRFLTVVVEESGQGVSVRDAEGTLLAEYRLARGMVEQRAARGERYYGLGAAARAGFDLRGGSLETRDAFLLSSAGYGEYYPRPGKYRFDLQDSRSVAQPEERVEFYFYYGPTVKGVFEEHLAIVGPVDAFDAADFRVREPRAAAQAAGSWETLGESVRRLLAEALSAKLIPAFDLTPYERAEAGLAVRAAELSGVMPVLRASGGSSPGLRERLRPYLLSYTKEARDRGVPVLRPLEIDSGDDASALNRAGEFMVGDELLAAPVLGPRDTLAVYLPRGVWTDLRTEETYRGRREISVPAAKGLTLFAKNGSIVPLGAESGDILELHYFPSAGGEFFLFEGPDADVSQFHAAPAGACLRLEIESKAARVYDWVVHHAGASRKVTSGGVEFTSVADAAQLAPGRWHEDRARKLLRIRVRSAAGGDEIVNVTEVTEPDGVSR
jgi:hypothetical protein